MKPVATCLAPLALALASLCTAQVTPRNTTTRAPVPRSTRRFSLRRTSCQRFGKLGAFKVDGPVYAQPLFVPNVEIPGKGTHDVLYVATEHDSVFAFDANRPATLRSGR